MIYRFRALLLLSILASLPVGSFADMYIPPKPYLLESTNGDLRFVILPEIPEEDVRLSKIQEESPTIYSLVLGDQIYMKSGLYKADDATNPLWTVELNWWDGSVHLSDDGQYLVNSEDGVAFYKNGVIMRKETWNTLIAKEPNVLESETDDSCWLFDQKSWDSDDYTYAYHEAFYPSKNYFELGTGDHERFLFDITTGDLLAFDQVTLPSDRKNKPAESGGLNELLQNVQEGHSWRKVLSAQIIIDSNRGRARHPCTASKHGGRSLERDRVGCFDVVGPGWSGPRLQVVPLDDRFPTQFAIGQDEISRGDYAKYCALSRRCKVAVHESVLQEFPASEPITGITLANAQAYAAWLSKQTGKTYRLPTRAEWEYAGYADGKPYKKANCPARNGSYSSPTAYGTSNAWGLINFVGNVQEWTVEQNDEIRVSGGHYRSDSDTECSVQFSQTHSGQADKFTGFRLVREEVDQ